MRIEARFDNYPPKEVFVFEGDVSICPAEPVNGLGSLLAA